MLLAVVSSFLSYAQNLVVNVIYVSDICNFNDVASVVV